MHWASLRPSLTATSIAAGVRRPLVAALKQPGTVVAGGKPVIATPAPGLPNIGTVRGKGSRSTKLKKVMRSLVEGCRENKEARKGCGVGSVEDPALDSPEMRPQTQNS